MTRARLVAEVLRAPALDAHRGLFYLGATAPDIRVLTRRDRIHTHFFDLECLDMQDSVAKMLEQYPGLRDQATLDAMTRAFMAGLITHLVLDEVYIDTMYRDYFGARSSMAHDPFADVLDRALQYEMNRRELEDVTALRDITSALEECEARASVDFIDGSYLGQWREVVLDFARQGPTWDRFPRMMNIHLRRAGMTDEQIEEHTKDGPALAQRSLDYVGEVRVARFVEDATRRAQVSVERYLAGPSAA
ncbi:MAG: zinc dependent phospholipase C family protein [Dehalococcoidia bacterium]|nr:zinc dependent phospholipase C family protein [Dehalococcoidia bacterium]